MRQVRIQPLTAESFEKYGQFRDMLQPYGPVIGGGTAIQFFRDMLGLKLNGKDASFSICQVKQRGLVIDATEFHNKSGEAIMPLDGDVLMHVAPASPDNTPPTDEIEVFMVPKGTMVVLNPGVWHHAVFTTGEKPVNTLIVLPERTYVRDCTVVEIKDSKRVEITV